MFKWWILLSTIDNAELVFIISIYWIAIYPVDRAITTFERPEPGHASSGLLQEVKNNVKTVANAKSGRSQPLTKGSRASGGCGGTWVNFAGYVPLASQSPYPITMPRRLMLARKYNSYTSDSIQQ